MKGRDMTGCGRYPPQPLNKPIAFYSCARLGDPEKMEEIMATDPYFITQDNGAGSPLHFATTYKQLDMVGFCCFSTTIDHERALSLRICVAMPQ